MVEQLGTDKLLQGYRVLDLTDEKGLLCGKILADGGADVILVEKRGGNSARNLGPFYRDIPHPDRSLFWLAFNTNKKSIALDIETRDGQELFKRLVKLSDIVVESFAPGYLDSLGIGYSTLAQVNSQIIMTSITPFGQTGPYKDYKASDIVCMAMGGYLYTLGDPDRPPVRVSFPQAYLHAASEAAAGSVIALYHREMTGEGQWVDVSIQQSVCWVTQDVQLWWDLCKVNVKRAGPLRRKPSTGLVVPIIWPCKDGYMSFLPLGGQIGGPSNRALVRWMDSEGMASRELKEIDWDMFDWAIVTEDQVTPVVNAFGKFFLAHTMAQLYEGALKNRVMLYPVNAPQDSLKDVQLTSRGYWVNLEHPELGTSLTYPGAFAKMSETPLRIQHRAPLIGEHNLEVYERELGLSKKEIATLKKAKVI